MKQSSLSISTKEDSYFLKGINFIKVMIVYTKVTWHQALLLFFFFFFFFASLLLWLERERNNAWYIHLTSHQPPPYLHNLTSAWPVMLLANQRLPDRNQTLVGIMSLSKWILGKTTFLSSFRWRFLKKNLNASFVMKYYRTVPYLYLTATNNKEFTGKSSLT